MTFDEIMKNIGQRIYAPIYLLHGDESYFIDKISQAIEKSVLSEAEKSFNQAVVYGKDSDFKTVVDEARQFPMMASHRVVIVREAQDMRSLKNLASYAENPSPQSVVVLNHKHKKFDSRTKLAKAIKANGVVYESKKIYDNKVAGWITKYLKTKLVSITPDAAMIAGEFLGADLTKISNELDKVVTNIPKESTIDAEVIKEMIGISKDYNVFELQKALGSLDTEKIFRIVEYFGSNPKANPLVLVLSSLYSFFQKVYITSYHFKKSDGELKGLLGLPTPYFVKEYRLAAQNFKGSKLINAFETLKSADLKSKGLGARNISEYELLKDTMIKIIYT